MNEIGITADAQPTDDFATIPDVAIQPDTSRVTPKDIAGGNPRSTQRVYNTDGSYMTFGLIPDNSGQFGIAFFDSSNTLISKITGPTQYVYDKTTGKNLIQLGKLPDGTYGIIVARSGNNVADVLS